MLLGQVRMELPGPRGCQLEIPAGHCPWMQLMETPRPLTKTLTHIFALIPVLPVNLEGIHISSPFYLQDSPSLLR